MPRHSNHPARSLSSIIALASLSAVANAATVLAPGDLSIVGFATDAPDAVAFVTWVDLEANTEIFFTDSGWACDGFLDAESVLKYTAPVSGLPAGTTSTFVVDAAPAEWSVVTDGSVIFSSLSPGDQVTAYQEAGGVITPLYSFDLTNGFEDCDDVDSVSTHAIPTGLVEGVTAVTFSHVDNMWPKPFLSTTAAPATLASWLTIRDRFIVSSSLRADFEIPPSFRLLDSCVLSDDGYTEYCPGTAPCIFVSGHDGNLEPASIADREHGCWDGDSETCSWVKDCAPKSTTHCRAVTLNDQYTQDITRRTADAFEAATGERCHLIVSRLARVKLDPNREVDEAAQGDVAAEVAYNKFHEYITTARSAVNARCGSGFLLDFHGHGHPEGRIEWGYKITDTQLRGSDAVVDAEADSTSIAHLVSSTGVSLSTLVRGADVTHPSLGFLAERATSYNASGYQSVPSPTVPAPSAEESYFQGGYNIEVHGSQDSGTIDAVQMELPRWLRADDPVSLDDYIDTLGSSIVPEYLSRNYGLSAGTDGFCPMTPTCRAKNEDCLTDDDCCGDLQCSSWWSKRRCRSCRCKRS